MIDALFEAVREAASRSAWSRGVELARGDAVQGECGDGEEIALRIATRGGLTSFRVTFYPRDAAWECECASTEDPCDHVAAAIIALRRARQAGEDLPRPSAAGGRVGYRLSRESDGGLSLERCVIGEGTEHPLTTTLSAIASQRVDGPAFVATRADLAVESALGSRLRGLLPREIMPRLLEALSACPDVRLDGEPVRASSSRVFPVGRLEDQGDGFRLSIVRDPDVTETFSNGVVLCTDTLRALAGPVLSGAEIEQLSRGRTIAPDDVAELVTETLPSLAKRIPLEIRTDRLPNVVAERPRIRIETKRAGDALEVFATLVYGDPPIARVDAGRLVPQGGPIPQRDETAERRLLQSLQSELELLPGRRIRLPAHEAVDFTCRLESFRGEVRGEDHRQFFLAPPIDVRVELREDAFDVVFESEPGAPPVAATPGATSGMPAARSVDAEAVLRAWREGTSLVPLRGGGFAPLPLDWLERYGQRVADLLSARGDDGALPRCALPDLARLCEALEQPPPASFAALESLVHDFAGLPEAPLPSDLRATLRGYQRRGVDWLAFLREAGLGALLADDMGLGKTLQALCAARGRTLVVAPTSVVHNWVNEIRRFRPQLRHAVYHGPDRRLEADADVTLTTYAILRLDADVLARESWDTVVLDETQNIKNPDSQAARAAYRLDARFRLALSGTPVENRLEELWSQFHFLNPGLLGGRGDFRDRYAKPIAEGNDDALAHLRERIRPFVLRRRKREVASELPPRTDVVLRCELSESERQVYDAILAATRRQVVERLHAGGSVLAVLEALLRLRQASCHAGLVPGQEARSSSKIELLLDTIDEIVAEGHKALVFSQWTQLLDRVEPHLASADVRFARLDGATRDRGAVVQQFQDAAGPPILLISLKAGGTGLNLTAADHVFLLDPWWNPAVEDQAADRAHRIGQDRPVLVHRLVARDTVEERILELQERKRSLSEAALGAAGDGASLTRDDLMALLQ